MNLLDISLGQAFGYCFSQSSYVASLIIWSIVCIAAGLVCFKLWKKKDNAVFAIVGAAIIVVGVLTTVLQRPLSVMWNTTPEQAQRGVFIG